MSQFAKLYETEEYGQIVVMLDANEDGNPKVFFYFQPPEFGVCSSGPVWEDDEEGWDNSEEFFHKVNEDLAKEFVKQIWEKLA